MPIETEMNGLPRLDVVRSISLYGLSDVRLIFEDGTDNYFARQQVFERLRDVELPDGVTPDVAPLFSPSGLVYRYVLREPRPLPDGAQDDPGLGAVEGLQVGARRRRRVGLRRPDDAVPGAARSDPARRRRASRSRRSSTALGANNGNAGGGFYSEGGQFYYVRGLGRLADAGGHRQRRPRGQERHPDPGEGRRPGRHRLRAAARPVRLQRPATTPSRASS